MHGGKSMHSCNRFLALGDVENPWKIPPMSLRQPRYMFTPQWFKHYMNVRYSPLWVHLL